MKLDRNNYEEYFLLYADGELSQAACKAVDEFVMRHPDLAEELDLLKATVLGIDASIQMPGKDKLLRPVEWKQESLTPLQQDMLLYVDNELPAAGAKVLEAQLQDNAALQGDMQLLLQTRLTAEAIPMPGKQELYKERNRKKVAIVPLNVIRWMAAAAVVAGLGWYFVTGFGSKQITTNNTALATNQKPASQNEGAKNTGTNGASIADNPITVFNLHATSVANKKNTVAANNKNDNTVSITQKKNANVSLPVAGGSQQKQLQPVATYQQALQIAAANPAQNQPRRVLVGIENSNVPTAKQIEIAANTDADRQNPMAKYIDSATPAEDMVAANVYHEDNASNDYISIGGAHIKKQKIRGLLRNVTRTVSRTLDKGIVGQVAYK